MKEIGGILGKHWGVFYGLDSDSIVFVRSIKNVNDDDSNGNKNNNDNNINIHNNNIFK